MTPAPLVADTLTSRLWRRTAHLTFASSSTKAPPLFSIIPHPPNLVRHSSSALLWRLSEITEFSVCEGKASKIHFLATVTCGCAGQFSAAEQRRKWELRAAIARRLFCSALRRWSLSDCVFGQCRKEEARMRTCQWKRIQIRVYGAKNEHANGIGRPREPSVNGNI